MSEMRVKGGLSYHNDKRSDEHPSNLPVNRDSVAQHDPQVLHKSSGTYKTTAQTKGYFISHV